MCGGECLEGECVEGSVSGGVCVWRGMFGGECLRVFEGECFLVSVVANVHCENCEYLTISLVSPKPVTCLAGYSSTGEDTSLTNLYQVNSDFREMLLTFKQYK